MHKNMHDEYFDWLCSLICNDIDKNLYFKVLDSLYHYEFRYVIEMDSNRAEDGIDLRYQFGDDYNYPRNVIKRCIDIRECSMLEMMIALSIRMENIMDDPDQGNRTARWFWDMIINLGLRDMFGDNFDKYEFNDIMNNLLDRRYEPNGYRSLFFIPKCTSDMRTIEIWYQAMWYLNDYLNI